MAQAVHIHLLTPRSSVAIFFYQMFQTFREIYNLFFPILPIFNHCYGFLLGIHLFSKRNLYILGLISGRTCLHNGQSHNITGLVIVHLFL